ncbi:polyphosphate polymerase domain-containing protein [Ruminococcus sp. Marseille-P6503]|uniref:polyphosphate polymerase domain-containing protein n=1 Tax=Ruminococcus sp. Marseille-P6503 TaxID=2364796 RepID=UPI000F544EEE|nr:polyphosphate polymerase domain-containing protein [Ruminococcus sp. Marseille-P6503]
MAQYQSVFKRYELKYRLYGDRYSEFTECILPYMSPDRYGNTTICNIYFDTPDFRLIRSSLEKPIYKEKLRLRTYGVPSADSPAFAELKKKYKGIVYKRRICLPYSEAYDWLVNGGPHPDGQVADEIERFIAFYGSLLPSGALFYDRISYIGKTDPGLRLTIDKNVRWRKENPSLTKGGYGDELFGRDEYIMEIKISASMPLWLSHILDKLKLYPVSCSKYGTAYMSTIQNSKGVNINV